MFGIKPCCGSANNAQVSEKKDDQKNFVRNANEKINCHDSLFQVFIKEITKRINPT